MIGQVDQRTSTDALGVALRDEVLVQALSARAVTFRHDLTADRRLTFDAIAPIAARLPDAWVLAHQAQYSPHEARGMEPLHTQSDLADVIRNLSAHAASVRAYNLELTSEFRDLADALDPPVRELVGTREGGLQAINLSVFVASPGAVTPAHPDRHHNLLLQLSGEKEVWIGCDPDRRRSHERVLDFLRCPRDGVAELPPAESVVLGPGDGIYIPPYAFHWTRLSTDPGCAFSIGFSTAASLRDTDAHDLDVRLRSHGWSPRPSNPDSVRGRIKSRLGARAQRRTARRSGSPVTVQAPTGGQ